MENRNDHSWLIDYHLKQLSQTQVLEVERQIQADPQLQAESESVQRVLHLLSAYDVVVPADIEQRTMIAIEEHLKPIRLDPELTGRAGFAGRLLSLRDLVAAAAMIAVAFGLLVPALNRARESGRRTMCESNLMNLGQATAAYAASFGGELPFASQPAGAYWMPVAQRGVPVADNRRHEYLLVRQNFATPDMFVCPSRSDGVVMVAEHPQAFESFPEPNNATYSMQCMAGANRPHRADQPAMPLMADQTPLFAGGSQSFGQLNSINHLRQGQNVLTMDGRVLWTGSPNVGIGGDNIWLTQDRRQQYYKGAELPISKTDAFLVH